MSYKATLTIDNKTFHLLECISAARQKTDAKGKPVSGIRAGEIQFVVLGTEDDLIPSWATDKKKKYDGTIAMYQWDQQTKFREISFKNAYVVFFSESFVMDPQQDVMKLRHFANDFQEAMMQTIHRMHEQFGSSYIFLVRISAEKITVDGIEHNNAW